MFDDWEAERIHRTREERIPESELKAPPTRSVRIFNTIAEVLGYEHVDGSEPEPQDEGALSADEAALLRQIESADFNPEDLLLDQ